MGYGISLDVKNVPVAVVLEDSSPTARDSVSFLDGSEYFSPKYVTSMREAEILMHERQIDAILVIPSNFMANFYGNFTSNGVVTIENRVWFNDANSSTWYFVPGLLVLIMTHSRKNFRDFTVKNDIV